MTDQVPSRSPQAPDWEALARYHAGESPAEEARLVASWLATNAPDAAMLASLDEALEQAMVAEQAAAELPGTIDVEAALRSVKARRATAYRGSVGRVLMPSDSRTARPSRDAATRRAARAHRTRVWWVAGGLAAAAAAALVVRRGDDGLPSGPDSAHVAVAGPQVLQPGQSWTTAVRHRESLQLSDGTRVTLAPGSRIVVAQGFGDTAREVTLEGQALFSVAHDAAQPFTVHAGRALVRDIGTVFTVRTDGVPGAGVAVMVTEGRVALRAATGKSSGVELAAGDRGAIGASNVPTAERGVVTDDDVAWASSGKLAYRAAALSTVAADLKRWYGIELRVDDPKLAAMPLTATFTNESAGQVVRIVALAVGAVAVRDGDVVTLRPVGAGR